MNTSRPFTTLEDEMTHTSHVAICVFTLLPGTSPCFYGGFSGRQAAWCILDHAVLGISCSSNYLPKSNYSLHFLDGLGLLRGAPCSGTGSECSAGEHTAWLI